MNRQIFINILVLLAAIIIQISLLPAILPFRPVPNLVLFVVVAWTLVRGFEKNVLWSVFSGILYDLAVYQRLGLEVIFFVIATYIISFYSRRFLVEHKFWGNIVIAGFVILLTLLNRFFIQLSDFMEKSQFPYEIAVMRGYFLDSLIAEILLNLPIFFILFLIIKTMDARKASYGPGNIKKINKPEFN